MAAACQQDMITILWVYKFKLNENLGLTTWPKCLPLKNSEGLSRNPNSTERFCKYE